MKNALTKAAIGLFACILSTTNARAQSFAVGTMKGEPVVNSSGALTYSIPILVPPGILQISPKISLEYNSQAGNGLLGIGWSITGLSAIERVPTDLHHDGRVLPVRFDANDALAFDGQRLIDLGSGTFSTAVANFSKIQAYGTVGAGPDFFGVEAKNGLMYEYGNTPDSKMTILGTSSVMMWSLNKVSDRNGNYMTYHYYNDPSTGLYYIDAIYYTGNDGTVPVTAPDNEIDFLYEGRGDNNVRYVAGATIQGNKRLSSIIVKHAGIIIHQYHLIYNEDFYSHLVQVTETDEFGNTLPPTIFNWGTATPNTEGTNTSILTEGWGLTPDIYKFNVFTGDFNGDGHTDCIGIRGAGITHGTGIPALYKRYNATGDDFVQVDSSEFPYNAAEVACRVPGIFPGTQKQNFDEDAKMNLDFNGDGKEDLLTITLTASVYNLAIHYSNGTSFDSTVNIYTNGGSDKFDIALVAVGNFLGNGKQQVLVAYPDNTASGLSRVYFTELIGDGGFYSHDTIFGERKCFQAMDFDGDGKDELFTTLVASTSSTEIYSFNTSFTADSLKPIIESTVMTNILTTGYPTQYHRIFFGDFNGDGKKDVLTWIDGPDYPWEIGYSTGTNFHVENMSVPSTLTFLGLNYADPDPSVDVTNHNIYVADFNGDGKDDILEMYTDAGTDYHKVYYSKGDFTFTIETNPAVGLCGIYQDRFSIGDFNGDGQADLLSHNFTSCYMRTVYFHKNEQRHLIHSIDKKNNSIGHEGQQYFISYLPVTQDTIHPDLSLAYPFCQVPIGGLKVVKSLTDNITMKKNYAYFGSCFHKIGLGFRGFESFIENDSSANRQSLYRNFTTQFESVMPQEVSVSVLAVPDTTAIPINKTDYGYSQDTLAGNIYLVYPLYSSEENAVTGSSRLTEYTYNGTAGTHTHLYNYGGPDRVTINVSGLENTTTDIAYDTTDPYWYNRFKPMHITTTVQRTGELPYSRNTDYSYLYTGNINQTVFDAGTPHENIYVYSYDNWGHVTQEQHLPSGLASLTKTYSYLPDGKFLTQSTDPLGYIETYTYDKWGNILTFQDIHGLLTSHQYDGFNRVVSTSSPTGVLTSTQYQWSNLLSSTPGYGSPDYAVITTTSGLSGSEVEYYDFYGRKLRTVSSAFDGQPIYKDTHYSPDNQVTQSTDPYIFPSPPVITTFDYDPQGRIIQQVSPLKTLTTSYTAEAAGMVAKTTNWSATPVRARAVTTDGTGKIVKVTDEGDSVINYEYHSCGKVKSTYGSSVYTRNYTYDDYGNMTSESAPNNGTITYSYNALDQITSRTDASSHTFTYGYDGYARLIHKAVSEGSYTYTYGTAPESYNKIVDETAPFTATSTHYTYDPFSRMTSKTETINGAVFPTSYTYTIYNQIATRTFPSGDIIQYNFNPWGYLSNVTQPIIGGGGILLWTKNTENAYGETTSETYGGVASVNTVYNSHGILTESLLSNGSGLLSDYIYSFDEATGDLSSRTDGIRDLTETFTYDVFDRLTSCTQSSFGVGVIGSQTLSYSQYGDITHNSEISPDDWLYTKHAVNAITNPTAVIPTFSQTATYTSFDKIKKLTENNNSIVFSYRADDQRGIAQYYTGLTLTKTRYYTDDYEKTIDAISGAVHQTCYVIADGKLVALLLNDAGTLSTKYVHTDYLGSITHILNSSGAIYEERSYNAWGRLRNPNDWSFIAIPTYTFDRGYTGEELLRDFNVINLNGRLYDPLIGRMFSVDPVIGDHLNGQSYNGFSYALNNPLKYNDRSGNNPAAGMIAGAILGGIDGYQVGMAKGAIGIDMLGYVLGGAAIGAAGGVVGFYAGSLVSSALGGGVLGGVVGGAAGGFAGGFISGAGNAWMGGSNFKESLEPGLKSGEIGGVIGGILGGFEEVTAEHTATKEAPENRNIRMEKGRTYTGHLRPDADKYLTWKEAKFWWKYGNGEPLRVDFSKLDLSDVYANKFGKVGDMVAFNLLTASHNLNDGLVYGQINLRLVAPNKVVVDQGFDDFDFDMRNWSKAKNWLRNLETLIGKSNVGQGKPYRIFIEGEHSIESAPFPPR